jgi:hypothetical protein
MQKYLARKMSADLIIARPIFELTRIPQAQPPCFTLQARFWILPSFMITMKLLAFAMRLMFSMGSGRYWSG